MRGVAPEKSLQFSAFTHTHTQGAHRRRRRSCRTVKRFFFSFLCAAPPDDPFWVLPIEWNVFLFRKNKIAGYIFFRLGQMAKGSPIQLTCNAGGLRLLLLLLSTTRKDMQREMKMFPPFFFFFFSILWKADPSVQLSAGHDQSRSQQLRFFFPFWLLLLTIFISLSPL